MQLIYQAGLQILPDGGNAAAQAHVFATRGFGRLLKCRVYAFGDKTELRAARHLERRARVMCEHEYLGVIRWLLTPPATPAFIRPRAAHRPEHVAPENPGADTGEALLGHIVVHAGLAAAFTVHLPPKMRMEEPLHQLGTADAERILQILIRPSAVTVNGYREAPHQKF